MSSILLLHIFSPSGVASVVFEIIFYIYHDFLAHNIVIYVLFFIFVLGDTFQNCILEIATIGDLKLVGKPSSFVLSPHDYITIKDFTVFRYSFDDTNKAIVGVYFFFFFFNWF